MLGTIAMTTGELDFYATQSAVTDPGRHGALFEGAPAEEAALMGWVRNVQFHEAYAAAAGLALPPEAAADPASSDAALRFVEPMLGRILARDRRPLSVARAKRDCFIGTCRDYAVLLAALLRLQGRPARPRCGFAFYYEPGTGFGADHWVTEVWDAGQGRWRLVDAEVDGALPQHAAVTVDPLDLPRDQFQTAGSAWRLHRAGRADPARYGVLGLEVRGEWFMAANVLRDLAALNKHEMTVFDYWGLGTEICLAGRVSAAQRALIDALAALIADESFDFAGLFRAYAAHPEVRLSDPVKAWPKGVECDFALGLT